MNRLPWNKNTLEGWIAETFVSFFFTGCYVLTSTLFLTLFVSICSYHWSFYKIYQQQIINISKEADLQPFPTDRVKKLLHESISYHFFSNKVS